MHIFKHCKNDFSEWLISVSVGLASFGIKCKWSLDFNSSQVKVNVNKLSNFWQLSHVW